MKLKSRRRRERIFSHFFLCSGTSFLGVLVFYVPQCNLLGSNDIKKAAPLMRVMIFSSVRTTPNQMNAGPGLPVLFISIFLISAVTSRGAGFVTIYFQSPWPSTWIHYNPGTGWTTPPGISLDLPPSF